MSSETEQIKIWVKSEVSGRRVRSSVDAQVFGPLAVHHDTVSSRVKPSERYSVTHLPTGYAIAHGLSEVGALRLVETLRAEPFSDGFWESVATLDIFRRKVAAQDPLLKKANEWRQVAASW
jgi:hypothetical protein